jgi:molybdopterin-guanine dinucleotide biosynthesis protein B
LKRLHIIGHHNSGKTTLILRLVPALKKRGLRVGVLKNAPMIPIFEGDNDSAHLAKSGADFTALAGDQGGAIFIPELLQIDQWEQVFEKLCPKLDLLLVEGLKSAAASKIEVWHEGLSEPPISNSKEPPLFFASETSLIAGVQSLSPDDVDSIVDRIYRWWKS